MEKHIRAVDEMVMIFSEQYIDYRTFWSEMKKEESPDQRLKKLFAEEKISADKYSEMFGSCTHRDVDDLVSRNPLPIRVAESKPFDIISAIDMKIYALALDPQSFYLMMGARNIHELASELDRRGIVRKNHGNVGGKIMYHGWEIKPAPNGYSDRHLEIVAKDEYRYLVDVNGRKYDYGYPVNMYMPSTRTKI